MYRMSFTLLKCSLLLSCFLTFSATILAQAPGNVNTDLQVWLKANDLNPADPTNTTDNWPDASGNNNDGLYQSPYYYEVTSLINFNKTVTFNDEWFSIPFDINTPDLNVFVVYENTTANTALWGNHLSTSGSHKGRQVKSNNYTPNPTGTAVPYSGANTVGDIYINHFDITNSAASSFYINGASNPYTDGGSVSPNDATNNTLADSVFLGITSKNNPPPTTSTGTVIIAEFIIYDGDLTQTEREKINSYLAIKYGITLAHDYQLSNGTTVWSQTAASAPSSSPDNYTNNIAGIAHDNGSLLEQVKSTTSNATTDLIIEKTGGVMPNNTALVWGQNGRVTNNTFSLQSSQNYFIRGDRIRRIWQCQKTGSVNGFDIELPATLPTDFNTNNIVLLVSDDDNFNSNVSSFAFTNGKATNVQIEDGQFVTIAKLDVGLWVKADAADNQVTAGRIDTWVDNLGGANTLTSPATASEKPEFVAGVSASAINFNPYLTFNQSTPRGQYISKNNYAGFGDEASIFMAARRKSSPALNDDETLISYAVPSEFNEFLILKPENITLAIDQTTFTSGQSTNVNMVGNAPSVLSYIQGDEVRLNADATNTNYKNNYNIKSGGTLVFGQDQDVLGGGFDSDQEYRGDIAEVIVFNTTASNDDVDIIESYLGIKYGTTLDEDYYLSDHNRTWNQSSNATYHNKVAGIGRDDYLQLNQLKSRSQSTGDIFVTMEQTSGSFAHDKSHLIWGENNGDYDDFSAISSTGITASDKVWKVANYNNNITGVRVVMEIPASWAGQNFIPVLVIANSANLRASTTTVSAANTTATTIIFENVTFTDGQYFTLGYEENTTFVNNTATAPLTFEGCIGDSITFFYNNFLLHPNTIKVTNATGGSFTVPSIPDAPSGSVGTYSGKISFVVPSNAYSGTVTLLSGTIPLFSKQNFIVHNPYVDFFPATSPVCAMDTVSLIGVPMGGVFSSPSSNLISNDSIVGLEANWGPTNGIVSSPSVSYAYTPNYTDGTACPAPIVSTKSIDIRDNRLDGLIFNYIITADQVAGVGDRKKLTLGIGSSDSTFQSITPFIPNGSTFSYEFYGTYVTDTASSYTFLTDISQKGRFPITLEYNNGGCIGRNTGILDIYPPLQFPGLADTLCASAMPSVFTRDTLPEYRDTTIVQTYPSGSSSTTTVTTRYNQVTQVLTDDPAFQSSITQVGTVKNNETFQFDPNPIPAGTPFVAIQMLYKTTTTIDTNGTNASVDSFNILAFDTIYIEARPVPMISNLNSDYCANAVTDTLFPSPIFENLSTTFFVLKGYDGSNYTLKDTLRQDTLLDFDYHYRRMVPAQDRNLSLQLTYVVDRYGCRDSTIVYTQIIAPVLPNILNNSPYCTSSLPTPINVGYSGLPPTGGSGVFYSAPGLDTTNTGFGIFNPRFVTPGEIPIRFEYTDFYGCVRSDYDTLIVSPPPNVELVANNIGDTSFCANDSSVLLRTLLLPNNTFVTNNVIYTGRSVSGNSFNPATAFGTGGGTTTLETIYTDSLGCRGYDTLVVLINPIPTLRIDSFNGLDDITLGRTERFDHKYCYNDSSFIIGGTPGHLTEQRGIMSGGGVLLRDSTYYYDPSFFAQNQTNIDLVTYRFTDNQGCSNIDSVLVIVDSIPNTSIQGITSTYCLNSPIDSIKGLPDDNILGGTSNYGGPGVNPSNGAFSPLRAGTGEKILSYSYQDDVGCRNTTFDTIIVNALPTPSFSGYQNQYCTAAVDDTLWSNNLDTLSSSFLFYGNIISDPTGILNPDNDTAGVQTIYYSYTDTSACTNIDSVNIFIHPTPEIVLSGLDSSYCFNAVKDEISVFPAPGFLSNNASGFSYVGNTISFAPNADSAGIKSFTYTYIDLATGCSDTLNARTYVYKAPVPTYTGLNRFYCETQDSFLLNGLTPGGSFSGLGIIADTGTYKFSPAKAGAGFHDITYAALDTLVYTGTTPNTTLVCAVDTVGRVEVRGLPTPVISSPSNNSRFCSTDTSVLIASNTINSVLDSFFSLQGGIEAQIDTTLDTIIIGGVVRYFFVFDTFYYFNPALATTGTNIINYKAVNNYGCVDSLQYTYLVDGYSDAQFAIDTVHCESDAPTVLFGVPTGGAFSRNGNVIPQPYFFDPNPNYIAGDPNSSINTAQADTLIYTVQFGACFDSDTQIVNTNPVPQLVLNGPSVSNEYCLSTDTISLTIQPLGGTLTGPGVLFSRNDMILNIAGAGNHTLYYTYQDTTTKCTNTVTDTFKVYGQPEVSFSAVGGCQLDSILFWPDNQILGLTNKFTNGRDIDSITAIYWDFEGLGLNNTPNLASNTVDSIHHIYSGPGVYQPKLVVTNRGFCTDTATVRLVISPLIVSYPYDETFDNSNGDWYAENRDASKPLLWQWGTDNTTAGINSGSNPIWETNLNNTYSTNEDGWVYSPCFDLDTLARPMLKLDYWSDTRQGLDGAVIEVQDATGKWTPLGQIGRGSNWYNSSIITGQPGDQNIAPLGWSGESNSWVDARYKLDEFLKSNRHLRMRIAFGSPAINLSDYQDGFAFDNVWIGDRTRNVLLETTSNISYPNMMQINKHVYDLAFHSEVTKDVTLVQYNQVDQFYQNNTSITNNVEYVYGNSDPAKAYIDGEPANVPLSWYLSSIDFETEMLETPKFSIDIDTFYTNSQNLVARARITANEVMPNSNYRIHTIITEDSLVYQNTRDMIQAVARKDDESSNTYARNWVAGQWEDVQLNWNHAAEGVAYNPDRFQVVIFIQDLTTREIFQVKSSRDKSGYLVPTRKLEDANNLAIIANMNLYPNPARDYFQVDLEQTLTEDYQWKLVDLRGVEIQSGNMNVGDTQVTVQNDQLPTGIYIFTLTNGRVFSQRKVVINNQ